jgi:hypothetical protein
VIPAGTLVMIVRPGNVPLGAIGTTLTPLRAYRMGWFGFEALYQVRFPHCPDPKGRTTWLCRPVDIIPILPPGKRDRTTHREPAEVQS